MGSSGSDSFSDYSGSPSGSKKENKCDKAFSASLENVATSEYYKKNKKVPPAGTPVSINPILNAGRLTVMVDKMILGNLPTSFHYLVKCLSGYKYSGYISSSGEKPIPNVKIDCEPTPK